MRDEPITQPSAFPSLPSVPLPTVLASWAAHVWKNGCQVESIPDLTPLQVCTQNTLYELIVISGREREVMVRGGHFFPEHTRVRLAGSSLGGCFLKIGGIYVGFCMELQSERRAIVTSAVRSIRVLDPRHA